MTILCLQHWFFVDFFSKINLHRFFCCRYLRDFFVLLHNYLRLVRVTRRAFLKQSIFFDYLFHSVVQYAIYRCKIDICFAACALLSFFFEKNVKKWLFLEIDGDTWRHQGRHHGDTPLRHREDTVETHLWDTVETHLWDTLETHLWDTPETHPLRHSKSEPAKSYPLRFFFCNNCCLKKSIF